jgi:hypothetical protein
LILLPPLLHSPNGGYLCTPLGFLSDKNALPTTTHSGNISRNQGHVRHLESTPALGNAGTGGPDRPRLVSPLDRQCGPWQAEVVGTLTTVGYSSGETCKTNYMDHQRLFTKANSSKRRDIPRHAHPGHATPLVKAKRRLSTRRCCHLIHQSKMVDFIKDHRRYLQNDIIIITVTPLKRKEPRGMEPCPSAYVPHHFSLAKCSVRLCLQG